MLELIKADLTCLYKVKFRWIYFIFSMQRAEDNHSFVPILIGVYFLVVLYVADYYYPFKKTKVK